MIIDITTSDLTLDSGFLSTEIITSEGQQVLLNFESLAEFNKKYVHTILKLCAANVDFFKSYTLTANNTTYMQFNIQATSKTMFLFETLKRFGVTLNELRLGISKNNGTWTLYLLPRIYNLIYKLGAQMQNDLSFMFLSLAKLMYALVMCNPDIVVGEDSRISILKEHLEKLYLLYDAFGEKITFNVEPLKDGIIVDEVTYNGTHFNKITDCTIGLRSTCEFTYNTCRYENKDYLFIINKSFIPNECYVINDQNTIYTNADIDVNTIFDNACWLNFLVSKVQEVFTLNKSYTIKHVDLDSLFKSDLDLSVDAGEFEPILENIPALSENTNKDLYKDIFTKVKVNLKSDVTDIAKEYENDPKAQQLYKQIKEYYRNVDLKDLTNVPKGILKHDIYSLLFEGESGTGKSTAARAIATKCGIPYIAINCSQNIEESDIIGTFIANPDRKTDSDPVFIWQDGLLTQAVRRGYIAIIEELGGARPGVLMKLNSLLDEARQLDLPTGEIVKAHPNFAVIATTNIGYEGTNRLNKALIDRFEICKKFKDLTQSEALKIVSEATGYTDMSKMSNIYAVYNAIKKYSTEQNLDLVVSIRHLIALFKQGKYYRSATEAVEVLLLNTAFIEEPDHLEYFKNTLLKAFDLSFKI